MGSSVAYAHTAIRSDGSVDPDRSRWQQLDEHLENVAHLASAFLEPCGLAELGDRVGRLHDLGKFSVAFQHRLAALADDASCEAGAERVDHATAGALQVIFDTYLRAASTTLSWPSSALAEAFCVAFHHGGLQDREDLRRRLEIQSERRRAGSATLLEEALAAGPPSEFVVTPPLLLPSFVVRQGDQGNAVRRRFEFMVRVVYSALLDADFLDTESHMSPEQAAARRDVPSDAIGRMRVALDEWLGAKFGSARASAVNAARESVLESCRVAAERERGLFTLTAPTGTGKTLSSLAFALRHAERHGLRRVVVVIPYTSIIDQTASTFRDWLADCHLPAEWLLEHHSGVSPDRETRQSRLAAENWDVPLVVTTSVQFFESLHARKSSSVRKLHRLVQSVVVLDEVQTLPPGLLQPCLDAIGHLVREYGASVVVATATQPALMADIRKVDGTLVEGLATVSSCAPVEIVPRPQELVRSLGTRVRYSWASEDGGALDLTWADVVEKMLTAPYVQALAVVNTRGDARRLFEAVRARDPEAHHLSALMCAAHRRAVLDDIRSALDPDRRRPCLVVSTQLVEAGVNVDFPLVLRALAGLDSVVQAAGRCNREGRLQGPGEVTVFAPKEGGRVSPTVRLGADICRAWLRDGDPPDPNTPDVFARYFQDFYARQSTDEKGIRALRQELAFEKVAREFQLIDDGFAQPVLVPHEGWEAALDRFHDKTRPARERWRFVQPFLVNVRRWDLERLESARALQEVAPGLCLCPPGSPFVEYDDKLGLLLKGPVANPEDLIR